MAGSTTNYGLTKPAVGEAYDINIGNNNSDIIDTQILNRTKQALGLLQKTQVATSTGAISALAVVNNIATYTFKAGRKYRIVWDSDWYGASANTSGAFSVATCSTADAAALTTGLTTIGLRNAQAPVANVTAPFLVTGYLEPVADTTVQLKFCAAIDGSGTTLIVQGNRTGAPSQYRIYDDGAQF